MNKLLNLSFLTNTPHIHCALCHIFNAPTITNTAFITTFFYESMFITLKQPAYCCMLAMYHLLTYTSILKMYNSEISSYLITLTLTIPSMAFNSSTISSVILLSTSIRV